MDDDDDLESMQGMLLKWGGNVIKRHQERWFELRKGVLYYYSAKPLGRLDLAHAKVESVAGNPHSFMISGPNCKHSYTLKGESEGEKAIWMARLQQAIHRRTHRRGGAKGAWERYSQDLSSDAEGASRASGDKPTPGPTGDYGFEATPTFTERPLPYKLKEDDERPRPAEPRASNHATGTPAQQDFTPTFIERPLPYKLRAEDEDAAKAKPTESRVSRATSDISIHRQESGASRAHQKTPSMSALPDYDALRKRIDELTRMNDILRKAAAGDAGLRRVTSMQTPSGTPAARPHSDPASSCAPQEGGKTEGGDEDTDTDAGTVVVRDDHLSETPRRDDPYATFSYMETLSPQSAREKPGEKAEGSTSPGGDKQNEVIERMKKQLFFEREEQRALREDLCQEIDRLKEELRAAYARMQSAEDQAEQLLTRAMAHKKGEFTSHTPKHSKTPSISGWPARASQPPSEDGGTPHNRSMDMLSAPHVRAKSHDFGASRLRRDDDGVVTHVPESQLQSKLEQQMVAKYIELQKVLLELQDVGIERVEHTVHVTKQSESEDIGVTLKKGTRQPVIRAVRGAAYRAKLKPGMIIISVDGVLTPTPDAVVAAVAKYTTEFEIVVTEPLTELVARVEGNALLAEERDAILRENDRLKQQAMFYASGNLEQFADQLGD